MIEIVAAFKGELKSAKDGTIAVKNYSCPYCNEKIACGLNISAPKCTKCGANLNSTKKVQEVEAKLLQESEVCPSCSTTNYTTSKKSLINCVACGMPLDDEPEVDSEADEDEDIEADDTMEADESWGDDGEESESEKEELEKEFDDRDEESDPLETPATEGEEHLIENKFDVESMVVANIDNTMLFIDKAETKIVASLKQEDMPETIKEQFNNFPIICKALAAVQEQGYTLEEGLKHYGIKRIVNKVSDKDVDGKINTIKAELDKKQQKEMETYIQSIIMSMIGIEKGFYDANNPIKEGLIAELKKWGIEDPDTMISEVFSNYASQYMEAVTETAKDIMKMSDEVRNHEAARLTGFKRMKEVTAHLSPKAKEIRASLVQGNRPVDISNIVSASTEPEISKKDEWKQRLKLSGI